MTSYKQALNQLDERCLAHRMAAEAFSSEDSLLKTTSSVLTAVVTALSFWTVFSSLPYIGYVLAGLSTVTAILASVQSARGSAKLGAAHFEVYQKLDSVKTYCLGRALEPHLTPAQIIEIVDKTMKDVQDTLRSAPLLPERFEAAAEKKIKDACNAYT